METQTTKHTMKMGYGKFALMMVFSFIVMYIAMFLNIDMLQDYHTSLTRIYMTLLMISPMAIVMIALMGKMYASRKTNAGIVVGAVVIFALALTGLRTQTPIEDVQWMKAMIPHHSSAIMVSKHATIKDPEARRLADSIIASQRREIIQMEAMLKRMGQ